jgi:hypothetical protein
MKTATYVAYSKSDGYPNGILEGTEASGLFIGKTKIDFDNPQKEVVTDFARYALCDSMKDAEAIVDAEFKKFKALQAQGERA